MYTQVCSYTCACVCLCVCVHVCVFVCVYVYVCICGYNGIGNSQYSYDPCLDMFKSYLAIQQLPELHVQLTHKLFFILHRVHTLSYCLIRISKLILKLWSIDMDVHVFVCIHITSHVCMLLCTDVCIQLGVHVYSYMHLYTYLHTYTETIVYTHTRVCNFILVILLQLLYLFSSYVANQLYS